MVDGGGGWKVLSCPTLPLSLISNHKINQIFESWKVKVLSLKMKVLSWKVKVQTKKINVLSLKTHLNRFVIIVLHFSENMKRLKIHILQSDEKCRYKSSQKPLNCSTWIVLTLLETWIPGNYLHWTILTISCCLC